MNDDVPIPLGDVGRGAKLFKKHCAQCHTIDADGVQGNNIGPTMFNICGRCSGIYEKKGAGGKSTIETTIVWTDSQLMEYMRNPRSLTSGSIAMNFTGVPKLQDRADILTYLHTLTFPSAQTKVETQPPSFGKVAVYKRE